MLVLQRKFIIYLLEKPEYFTNLFCNQEKDIIVNDCLVNFQLNSHIDNSNGFVWFGEVVLDSCPETGRGYSNDNSISFV